MKNILRNHLTAFLMLVSTFNFSLAQQPNNGGFENWDNVGSNTEEPTNWSGMMTGDLCGLCGFGASQRVFRDGTDKHSGNYSARIESTNAAGTLVNGTITTGEVNAPSITPSQGYNMTVRSNANFNHSFSSFPDSVVFWAKYNITDNSDSARVSILMHGDYDVREPQDGPSAPYVVAKTIKNFQTNNAWVRISLPINYTGPSSDVQYLLATFTSSYEAGEGNENAKLWVDDLEFIYNPNTVTIAPETAQYLLVDQAGTQLEATETPNAESASATISREWKYSTTSGSGYVSFASAETGTTYTPQFNAVGTYYVVCESNFDGETVTSNEVEIIVSETIPNIVQIAPTATQNISVSADGTPLSATETPDAATSREWKYTTTSGSGYMSFITDEFGLTYTPNFATAGTYYVVCVSEINGETVTSNEVQINVTDETNSIGELTQENIVIYQKESNLVIDLSKTEINDVDMNLYNMDGRLVHSSKLSNSSQNIIQIDFPVGIYVITLSSDKGMFQQKVYVK